MMTKDEILSWLDEQLAEANRAVCAREQGAETFRIGTDEEWRDAARRYGGRVLKKEDRIKEAEKELRIAGRYRRDVEMLEEIITLVKQN